MTVMKQLRQVTFLVLAVCAFCLPAQAQKTYKADKADSPYDKNSSYPIEVTITITQGRNGYDLVSGEMKTEFGICNIQGAYYPSTEKLKARYTDCPLRDRPINGFKVKGEDALQITEPFSTLAKRVFSLSGSWRIVQTSANGARYTGTLRITQEGPRLSGNADWENHSQGTIKGEVSGKYIIFDVQYPQGLIGSYQAELSPAGDQMLNGEARSNKGGEPVKWQATRSRE
jgi:hypothetical protein